MLKRLINRADIDFTIIPIDPLLVKSGQATVGGANMAFVRTYLFGGEAKPFIPGSSLKGVIRSYAEKICRSLRDDTVPVCLPYLDPRDVRTGERGQESCGLRFERFKKDTRQSIPTPEIYHYSCPACRLFGSHGFVGRLATADAMPTGETVLEIRDGVAIDRFTGGAAPKAKYDLEVLARGDFSTCLEIRNFERWQLGLVALVLRDMEQGLVRLGYGKSRGLGRVRIEITRFCLSYYNQEPEFFSGIYGLCDPAEGTLYDFFQEADAPQMRLPTPQGNGLRREYDLTGNWREMMGPAVDDLMSYLRQVQWPVPLETYLENRRRGARE